LCNQAYFISGKFDVLPRPLPPFIDALDELCHFLPSNDKTLQLALREGLGNDKDVLIDLIPQFATVLGEGEVLEGSSEKFQSCCKHKL
jgi:hypothetical protein